MPERKKKLTRLERIIKGSAEIDKYVGFGAVLSSLGCIDLPPIPNIFSVSEGGRYIAVPFDEDLEIDPISPEQVLLYDINENKIVFSRDYNREAFWMSNNSNTISFQDGVGDEPNIIIMSEDKQIELPDRMFGRMSNNGTCVYTFVLPNQDTDGDLPKMDLMLRDSKTGIEKSLGCEGILSDFSPDGKNLLFLEYQRTIDPNDNYFNLVLLNLGTNSKRVIDKIGGKEGVFFTPPNWIDNEQFTFPQTHKYSEGDFEIILGNIDGELEQITANQMTEVQPKGDGDGRFFYNDESSSPDTYMTYEGEDYSQLLTKKLDISTPDFRIVRGKMFYAIGNDDPCGLFKTSIRVMPTKDFELDEPNEPIDLTARIRSHLIRDAITKDPNRALEEDSKPYLEYMDRHSR